MAEYDGEPNGLKIHWDGRVFLAEQGLMSLDPGGQVEPISTGLAFRPPGGARQAMYSHM